MEGADADGRVLARSDRCRVGRPAERLVAAEAAGRAQFAAPEPGGEMAQLPGLGDDSETLVWGLPTLAMSW
jgi:hypothetical protein